MSRLTHSENGFRRALQISKARVHAFVEGGPDRGFADSILRHVCGSIPYQVYVAKELPSQTGGKAPLLSQFEELRENDQLDITAWGKTAVCLFCLDKDVDDLTGDIVNSDHILYTQTYDLEGHLIQNGDLVRAVASSTYTTLDQAAQFIGDKGEFLMQLSMASSNWLSLCVISKRRNLNVSCNFSRQIPVDQYSPPLNNDIGSMAGIVDSICERAGISRQEFEAEFADVSLRIQEAHQQGNPLRYFKGKWLRKIFQDMAVEKLRVDDAHIGSIGENIVKMLISQVLPDSNCRSTSIYVNAIRAHIDRLNLAD